MRDLILIDGPMGTELNARGVPTPLPLWSAVALRTAPEHIAAIHRAYAEAGATVHTANTFRTTEHVLGADWRPLCELAVSLTRGAVPAHHRVAGSIAPVEDCYRPDLSPPVPLAARAHAQLADALAEDGCDLLLVETFPQVDEALIATRAAAQTGLPVWTAFTAGPEGDLLSPEQVRAGADAALEAGAEAVFINCTAPHRVVDYVDALRGLGAPIGAYANAGKTEDALGWGDPMGPEAYAALAGTWLDAGATLIGSCCGTGPAHTIALASLLERRAPTE